MIHFYMAGSYWLLLLDAVAGRRMHDLPGIVGGGRG